MRSIYFSLVVLIALTAATFALASSHATPARSGETVFATNCANCHTGGISGFFSGAPDIEDSEDWEALAPKGLDALAANTIAGIGNMVARGACVECTDEEIRSAVEYMLESAQ